jgi:hypothetical protein
LSAFRNLIRVVSGVHDDQFDISSCRTCALAHAARDECFETNGFKPNFVDLTSAAEFFDIDKGRVALLLFYHYGYRTRKHVLAALRVLLIEKLAVEAVSEIEESGMAGEIAPAAKVDELELV